MKIYGHKICGLRSKIYENLRSMSEFVGSFGFGGDFGGILLFLLCEFLALLIFSVMLMIELDFDDVTDLLSMTYFSLISLSIFSLVNGKLLLVLSTCVIDMPSKSQVFSLQILPFSKFSANLINFISIKCSFSSSSSKIFSFSRSSFSYQTFLLIELPAIWLQAFCNLYVLYWNVIVKICSVSRKMLKKNSKYFNIVSALPFG